MTSGAARLLREEEPRATFLDLFFDLVFVFALFQLSQGLLEHLSWSGAFQTLVLLLAVLLVWALTNTVTVRFDPVGAQDSDVALTSGDAGAGSGDDGVLCRLACCT